VRPPADEVGGRIWASQGGRSRNKVAVGEPAAGSPPFDPVEKRTPCLTFHAYRDATRKPERFRVKGVNSHWGTSGRI
jgi:hypothetical protein